MNEIEVIYNDEQKGAKNTYLDTLKDRLAGQQNVLAEIAKTDPHSLSPNTELIYKALRSVIKNLLLKGAEEAFRKEYDSIMLKEKKKRLKFELLDRSLTNAYWIKELVHRLLKRYVYHSEEIVKNQIMASKAVDTILQAFVKAALKMGFDNKTFDDDLPEDVIDRNVYHLFSENYRLVCMRANDKIDNKLYKMQNDNAIITDETITADEAFKEKAFNCLLLAMDVFTGMTDSFALEVYHLLTAASR
jgi:dGTP triphosphohydrolase